jgi:hypothetical protein
VRAIKGFIGESLVVSCESPPIGRSNDRFAEVATRRKRPTGGTVAAAGTFYPIGTIASRWLRCERHSGFHRQMRHSTAAMLPKNHGGVCTSYFFVV